MDKSDPATLFSATARDSLSCDNTMRVGKSDDVRMWMLSLRYRISSAWLERNCGGVIKYASVAFQASNLFMITPYKESDPETGSLAGTMQPVLTFNLSLTF